MNPKLIIHIKGGCVVGLVADEPIDVLVLDSDNINDLSITLDDYGPVTFDVPEVELNPTALRYTLLTFRQESGMPDAMR